jgi:hypothetical protein
MISCNDSIQTSFCNISFFSFRFLWESVDLEKRDCDFLARVLFFGDVCVRDTSLGFCYSFACVVCFFPLHTSVEAVVMFFFSRGGSHRSFMVFFFFMSSLFLSKKGRK